ncbi:MAG: dihydroorotate dehydrogenase-like protein [Planctomycetales bacterium]|nr:dihydroorotate dehydrogenase-like protein [Planctomycetales bacterium]
MDISTTYLGLELPNPFISGAGPLADHMDTVRRLEDAGIAAIVMRSLFEEQLMAEGLATYRSMDVPANSHSEAMSYFPALDEFVVGPEEYLDRIRRIKDAVNVPLVGSLNGTTPGGWLDYARQIEQAGADALELHIYSVPTDPNETGEARVADTIEMVRAVREAVSIPLAAKLSPFYSSFANVAKQLDEVGADALVLFNRFYQPDIDVENLEVVESFTLSTSAELSLRLRWLAIVSGHVGASLGVTGGVHTSIDAIKAVMCGAHGVQLVSALLKRGPQHVATLRQELSDWLEEHEYENLRQMQGSMSLLRCPDPRAFVRGNYAHVLQTWRSA